MSKKPMPSSQANEETARREFLKQVGKGVAVTGPAIALLLAASSKPASAQGPYNCVADGDSGEPDDCLVTR
jgi:hypothetical protein